MNPLIPALIGSIMSAAQPSAVEQPGLAHDAPLRSIPAEAGKAQMAPPADNAVQLGSKLLHLSPGAQIRSTQNLIVMPSQVQQPALVRYLTDANGDVTRIWILTAEEAARPDPK